MMNLIASIIYGLVSGLTEIFPVSAQANQMVMRQLLGLFPDDKSDGICPSSFYHLWGNFVGDDDAFARIATRCGCGAQWAGGWFECFCRMGE